MENPNNGFQVIFRIGKKPLYTLSEAQISSIQTLVNSRVFDTVKPQQYPEDGIGIRAFDLYREHSGKADLSFAEFVDLNLKVDFWNDKKEFPVSISEKIARESGKFNYRSQFICWVLPETLKKFEVVKSSPVDTKKQLLQVTLDFDKVVEAWVEAESPEEWK